MGWGKKNYKFTIGIPFFLYPILKKIDPIFNRFKGREKINLFLK